MYQISIDPELVPEMDKIERAHMIYEKFMPQMIAIILGSLLFSVISPATFSPKASTISPMIVSPTTIKAKPTAKSAIGVYFVFLNASLQDRLALVIQSDELPRLHNEFPSDLLLIIIRNFEYNI